MASSHFNSNGTLLLDRPLVEYTDEAIRTREGELKKVSSRAGYLLQVREKSVTIQPIGAAFTIPETIVRSLDEVWMVDRAGRRLPEPVSLPASAGDVQIEEQLHKERTKNMAEKAAKKSKKKEAKPATVKYLELTDKAPETKDLKEGSHAYAVIAGLRRLSTGGVQGKATREKLMETITNNKLIKTDMDISKAISWMIGQLKGKGALKIVKEAV